MYRERILLVDDDGELRGLLAQGLRKEGFEVETASNPEAMRALMPRFKPDLITMDLIMPGEYGITATRTLRQTSDVFVIILTAKGEDLDRIIGLEMGADDYVAKPFNTRELVARIRAVLRRGRRSSSRTAPERETVTFEGWTADMFKRLLYTPDGNLCDLTSGEFDLLRVLLESPGQVLSRSHLLERTKGRQLQAFDRSVDIQISRLRNKMEIDPKAPDLIKTIRSSGYMLTAAVETI